MCAALSDGCQCCKTRSYVIAADLQVAAICFLICLTVYREYVMMETSHRLLNVISVSHICCAFAIATSVLIDQATVKLHGCGVRTLLVLMRIH